MSSGAGGEEDSSTVEGLAAQLDGTSVDVVLSTGALSLNDLPAYRAFDCTEEVFGLKVNSVPIPAATRTSVQAVLAEQVQLGEVSVGQIGAAVVEGASLSIIGPHDVANDYVLVAAEDVQTPADMAGRTHGAAAATGVDPFNFNTIYENAGVGGEVQVVLVGGSSDRVAALLSGNIDAAMLHPYDAEQVLNEGGFHQLAVAADEVPPVVNDVFFVESSWLEENRAVALAFSACVFAEADWLYENPEKATQYALDTVPDLDEDITERTMNTLFDIHFWGTEPLQEDAVATTLENDEITKVSVSDLLATDLMQEARALANSIER